VVVIFLVIYLTWRVDHLCRNPTLLELWIPILEMGFHILLVDYHLPILVVWEAPLAPGWEAMEVMEDMISMYVMDNQSHWEN
jgi:hypothetical protein